MGFRDFLPWGTREAALPQRGASPWLAADTSQQGVAPDLEGLRRRSRHATLNNPWLNRGVAAWVGGLVGTGIGVTSQHPNPATRKALQAGFARFGQRCDAEGRLDLFGAQAAVARSMVVDGEAFIHWETRPEGLQLRQIPADMVESALSRELGGGARIIQGIEFNSAGERVAYHVLPQPPGAAFALAGAARRIPAEDMLHVFRPLFAGQVRGTPWAAPVLLPLGELDALLDALLVGAKVAALHAGFLTDSGATATGVPYDGEQIGSVLATGLEPGTLKVLPAGMDIKFTAPAQAAQGIEHAKLQLRGIAAGLGIPEHWLHGDLSAANYSSLRAGTTEFRTRLEQVQWGILIPQLCRPVWERWLTLAVLRGEVDAPDFEANPDAWLAAEFFPPAMALVDPLKDLQAEAAAIAAGLKSRRQAVAERGYDVEVLDLERAADMTREQALGLAPSAPKEGAPDA